MSGNYLLYLTMSFAENLSLIINVTSIVILMIFFSKILFLEAHTPKQIGIIRKMTEYGLLLGILMSLIAAPTNNIYCVIAVMWLPLIPLVYSVFTGRKKHKWLAILSLIPLFGYVTALDMAVNILHTLGMIDTNYEEYIVTGFNCLLAVACVVAYNRNPRFVRSLKKSIESRALSLGEELIICGVGCWLAIYSLVLSTMLFDNCLPMIVIYIIVMNAAAAVIILFLLWDSNYRKHYQEQMENLQKTLISTMADLVENRDENTGGHIQRTAKYVEVIARKLKEQGKYAGILTEDYINDMVVAAPLHDVGKIHVPDAVLNKPGRLDDAEFSMMQSHTGDGAVIIGHVEQNTGDFNYLIVAKEMAEYHHEKVDGTGYPQGLAGERIPLCARILAVADVFDALVSKRCYKEPMPIDKALGIIAEESGTHFDPEVAAAFLECREQIEEIMEELLPGEEDIS